MTNARSPSFDLKKILAGGHLPALPQSAIRLLELSRDPENGPAEFATPIESDPGLTGQVLRFVNSSYFGFSREISSVKLAITLVGVRTIKNFALWSAVFSLMPNPKCGPFDLKNLWQDSLRRALFARTVSKLLGLKEIEESFSAALLQDMAVPLLAREVPELYVKLLEARKDGRMRLSHLEQKVFGWTHGEVAGIMARQWNLPEVFALMVENHQAIDRWVCGDEADAGKLAVALSALLPSTTDAAWYECEQFEDYYRQATGEGSPAIASLFEEVDEQFDRFAPLLKLSSPGKSLVHSYHEMTSQVS